MTSDILGLDIHKPRACAVGLRINEIARIIFNELQIHLRNLQRLMQGFVAIHIRITWVSIPFIYDEINFISI